MSQLPSIGLAFASLAGMVGLLAVGSCSPAPPGVEYRGETLEVVDIHLHTGHWDDIRSEGQRTLASFFPFPLGLQPDATSQSVLSSTGLIRELDRAGLSRGIALAVYAPKSVGVTTNEDVIALVRESREQGSNRLLGMASLRFDRWGGDWQQQLEQLSAALQEPGMVGIKLAPPHQDFRMDDDRLHALWEVAAIQEAPVYIHTGSSPFPGTRTEAPYIDPRYLEADIAAHPNTIFILGHMGYDFRNEEMGSLETCIELASRYPNVYLEPSALGSRAREDGVGNLETVLTAVRDAGLVDRLIYGSDGPQSPGFLERYIADTLTAMEEVGFSVDEVEAMLRGNFERVYQQ